MKTVETNFRRIELKRDDVQPLKVKMFIHCHPQGAGQEVTKWLNENDVIIHHTVQSQSEKGGNFLFVITLFYKQNY